MFNHTFLYNLLNDNGDGYQDHKVAGGGDVLSLGYDELIGPLIKALQEVNQKLDVLKQEFDDYVETHS